MADRPDIARLHTLQPMREPPAAASGYGEREELTGLGDYLLVLRRHLPGILGLALLVLLAGWFTALQTTPVYEAETKLLVEPVQPTTNVVGESAWNELSLVWLFYETQYEIIKSRAVARRVVEQLGLEQDEVLHGPTLAEPGSKWRAWLPLEWQAHFGRHSKQPDVKTRLVNEITGDITVEGGTDSQIIVVRFRHTDPQQAMDITNALADAYIEFGFDTRLSTAKQTSTWLSSRLEELRQKLQASEAALENFQQSEGMVGTDNREKIIGSKMVSLSSELIKAQSRRGQAEARHRQVQRIKKSGGGYESLISMLNNAAVTSLQQEKFRLAQKVAELSERYGEKHPKMIAARSESRDVEIRFRTEVNKAIDSIRKEYEVALAQERDLRRLSQQQQNEMTQLTGKAFQLAKLEREVESNRQIYEMFLARFKEMDVSGESDVSNVHIVDRAELPLHPVEPDIPRILAIALTLGIMLGIGFAFMREYLDQRFHSKEDIENQLNLPVLGMIPRVKLKARAATAIEQLVGLEPFSPFSESVNDVRTSIIFSNLDQPPKTILVTSAIPGEGKTSLASNLALAFSRRGRTLLVEGDLRKYRLSQLFGCENHPGLTNLVAERNSLKECLVQDPRFAGLFVLGCGQVSPNPLEVLASQRLARLLESLCQHFDHIVIDGTPLLPVSDGIVMSHLVDSVVLAVQYDAVTYAVARDALKRLQSSHVQPIGAVLTQVNMKKTGHYAGGGSAAYGTYYQYYEPAARDADQSAG